MAKVGRGDGSGQGERGYLGEGVDSCVGAAGALGEDGFAGDVMDGVSEGSLDGWKAWLDLPAVERGSVVGEDEFPEGHGYFRTVSRGKVRHGYEGWAAAGCADQERQATI